MRPEMTEAGVIKQAQAAWRSLKTEQSWYGWLTVGRALMIGREIAMRQATTNDPRGRGYNTAFGLWLTKNGFHDIDHGTRSDLFKVMDHEPEIAAWRSTIQPLDARFRINHPHAVWRRFQAASKPSRANARRLAGLTRLKAAEHAQARAEEVAEEIALTHDAHGNGRKMARQMLALGLTNHEAAALLRASLRHAIEELHPEGGRPWPESS